MASDEPAQNGTFPITRWSLIARATGPLDGVARAALDELVARYSPALRAHLVQARRVLEQNLLLKADPARGKFRTFLLTSLRNCLVDSVRAARAKGPHGGV